MSWSYDPTDLDNNTASGRLSTKTCNDCKEDKELTEFSKNSSSKDGFRSECKVCKGIKDEKYRLANKSKIKERQKNYYSNNKSTFFHHNATRRARHKLATPTWLSCSQKAHIKRTYDLAELMEDITGEKHHVDHIIPLKGKGVCGLHVPWNLQVLPASVNLSKSNSLGEN